MMRARVLGVTLALVGLLGGTARATDEEAALSQLLAAARNDCDPKSDPELCKRLDGFERARATPQLPTQDRLLLLPARTLGDVSRRSDVIVLLFSEQGTRLRWFYLHPEDETEKAELAAALAAQARGVPLSGSGAFAKIVAEQARALRAMPILSGLGGRYVKLDGAPGCFLLRQDTEALYAFTLAIDTERGGRMALGWLPLGALAHGGAEVPTPSAAPSRPAAATPRRSHRDDTLWTFARGRDARDVRFVGIRVSDGSLDADSVSLPITLEPEGQYLRTWGAGLFHVYNQDGSEKLGLVDAAGAWRTLAESDGKPSHPRFSYLVGKGVGAEPDALWLWLDTGSRGSLAIVRGSEARNASLTTVWEGSGEKRPVVRGFAPFGAFLSTERGMMLQPPERGAPWAPLAMPDPGAKPWLVRTFPSSFVTLGTHPRTLLWRDRKGALLEGPQFTIDWETRTVAGELEYLVRRDRTFSLLTPEGKVPYFTQRPGALPPIGLYLWKERGLLVNLEYGSRSPARLQLHTALELVDREDRLIDLPRDPLPPDCTGRNAGDELLDDVIADRGHLALLVQTRVACDHGDPQREIISLRTWDAKTGRGDTRLLVPPRTAKTTFRFFDGGRLAVATEDVWAHGLTFDRLEVIDTRSGQMRWVPLTVTALRDGLRYGVKDVDARYPIWSHVFPPAWPRGGEHAPQ